MHLVFVLLSWGPRQDYMKHEVPEPCVTTIRLCHVSPEYFVHLSTLGFKS